MLTAACGAEGTVLSVQEKALGITSPAFREGEAIPDIYSCDGENVSPMIQWQSVPEGTASFALIMDDPDAPRGVFTHWIIFNIHVSTPFLPKGLSRGLLPDSGVVQGSNSFNNSGFDGPCPPPGSPHHYIFTIYALDRMLDLPAGSTKAEVLAAMEGSILAKGQLTGTFTR